MPIIFLLVIFEIYSALLKDRYPRKYSYREKNLFYEVVTEKYLRPIVMDKEIKLYFIFTGKIREKIIVRKTIEELNKTLKTVKGPKLIIEYNELKDGNETASCWNGKINKIEVNKLNNKNKDINLIIYFEPWTIGFREILGTSSGAGFKNSFISIKGYDEKNKREGAFEEFRINTFKHELFHSLGFGHSSNGNSIMYPKEDVSYNLILMKNHMHLFPDIDVIFIEMKYNPIFGDKETPKTIKEKCNKIRRPDRRTRKQRLLYPIKEE